MTAKKQDKIVNVIRETITDILLNELSAYKLEANKINEISELSKRLSFILVGNGDPKNGLVFKMAQTQMEVVRLTELAKTRSTREWSLSLIGIGLIATSIWQIVVK